MRPSSTAPDRPSPARVRALYAMLTLVMLLWAGNSMVARAVHAEIPPFALALGRWAGALLVVAPFAWRRVIADWPVVRQHWGKILLLGLIGIGGFNALLYSGLRYTTATNGLLIQAAIPALVLCFDGLLFKARPRAAQIAGVSIAAIGVLTIILKADPAALLSLSFNIGDVLVLCAVLAWSLYTALLRLRPPIDPLSFLALTFAIGVLAMLPFAIAELRSFPLHFTPRVLGAYAYVALLPSVVAYFLYNKAVGELGAGAAGQVISLQPLFGALLAVPLLGEALHGYHLAGMAIILAGILIPAMAGRRSRQATASP
ncbi:DMT family transporter [Sphingomonas sp. NIBR02145]|uniref:DMT family transporter n=1 Tax=Sphingomonas sp. NIBR02145 TaxID=3014784 RepID=UPI0022B2B24D|nr:DMT family transporter [Sphingomonas sp. NIBR02145]WHU03189.1 DMT family transporter [Sphingomonas sp. NIBR02145]